MRIRQRQLSPLEARVRQCQLGPVARSRTAASVAASSSAPVVCAIPAAIVAASSSALPAPDVIAGEIVDDLRTALEQFEAIQTDLSRIGGNGARSRAGEGSRGTEEGRAGGKSGA